MAVEDSRLDEWFAALCATNQAGPPTWLRVLRESQPDLAAALDGGVLTVEVAIRGASAFKVGFTARGHVISPLGGGEADLVLRGRRDAITSLVLGDRPLADALRDGTAVIRTLDVHPGLVARVQHVVSARLKQALQGPLALIGFAKRNLWRLQEGMTWPVGLAVIAERAVPAAVAVIAVLTAGVNSDRTVNLAAASETPGRGLASQVDLGPRQAAGASPRSADTSTGDTRQRAAIETLAVRTPPASVAVVRSEGLVQAGVGGRVQHGPAPGQSHAGGIAIECDSAVRAILCSAIDASPTAAAEP